MFLFFVSYFQTEETSNPEILTCTDKRSSNKILLSLGKSQQKGSLARKKVFRKYCSTLITQHTHTHKCAVSSHPTAAKADREA